MMNRSADVAVIGAGIVGLAHAYMALKKGLRVVLFEREHHAVGASIRNFGLIWPIGQPPGAGLYCALRSRQHWKELAKEAGFWINNNGSIHLAYHSDEWQVLQEFMELHRHAGYRCELLTPAAAMDRSPAVNGTNLLGALWSETECTVDPREAIRKIPRWLEEKFSLTLRFGQVVTAISLPRVVTPIETWQVDRVFVCSGADFETLYPHVFSEEVITKCKLQMMRAVGEGARQIGPTLCAGLTMRHYPAFMDCPSQPAMSARLGASMPFYDEHGIHVLLAQNGRGEFIIGDSHQYSRTVEPFDDESVNEAILDYLRIFTNLSSLRIIQRWHGVYPKVANGANLVVSPEPGVTVVTGLGGAGMTLSFGLAEELTKAW